jgi:hypothetical protein
MRSRRNLRPLLFFLFAVLVSAGVAHAQQSEMLGYENWWANDPACPCNPDAWDIYIVYGYANSSGGYVVTQRDYAGRTTYLCGNGYHYGDFSYSSAWQSCDSQFPGGCPCASNSVREMCNGVLGSQPSSCGAQ